MQIDVHANGFERFDKPVEVALDADPPVARVLEIDAAGAVLDPAVPFQHDPDRLVFLLQGATPPDATRHFRVEYGSDATVVDRMGYTDRRRAGRRPRELPDRHSGRDLVLSQARGGLFELARRGWPGLVELSAWRRLGGRVSRHSQYGLSRGVLPSRQNGVAQPDPGQRAALREHSVRVERRRDALPVGRLPALCAADREKLRTPYWFLYEGTPGGNPGGQLDEENGYCVRSDGTRTPLSERWEGPLPAPEWLYFGAGNVERVLYLVHHEADREIDSYWPMEHNMTVFGFGRLGLEKYMTQVPAQFTVGFAPDGSFAAAQA